MAIADKTRSDLNFQKRGVCVAVCQFVESDILTDGSKFVNIPERSMITNVTINVTTASTTATSTLDVTNGTNVICNEVAVTAAEPVPGTIDQTYAYMATGGYIVVKAGAVTPAAGDLVGELVVEYIELDKTTGEYTTF